MPFFPVNYSTLSPDALLQLLLANYSIDPEASITFLKRGFNDTYLISTNRRSNNPLQHGGNFLTNKEEIKSTGQKFILRVYKHNWRSIESIKTELNLLNFLKENNISVSFPISDNKENLFQTIHAPEGLRYAVLFSFAEGIPYRKISVEQSYLLGLETGKIHSLTQNKSLGVTAHNYDIETQFNNTLTILKPALINHMEQYDYLLQLKDDFTKIFRNACNTELRKGICHGDLQAENFHITPDKQFTFFDFDFFGTGYLAYDIGVFMWYDHKNKTPEIVDAFLKGYQTREKLSATELKLIPYFSTLRALFQMTLFCKLSDGLQLPLWPSQHVADFVKKVSKWHNRQSYS